MRPDLTLTDLRRRVSNRRSAAGTVETVVMLQEDTNEAGAFCLKKALDVNTAKGPET